MIDKLLNTYTQVCFGKELIIGTIKWNYKDIAKYMESKVLTFEKFIKFIKMIEKIKELENDNT